MMNSSSNIWKDNLVLNNKDTKKHTSRNKLKAKRIGWCKNKQFGRIKGDYCLLTAMVSYLTKKKETAK